MGNEMRVTAPRVLMVDDEKKVADAYALRLEDVADVTVAYDGEEALAVVDEQPVPDVVLLDRHMPGLSGDEVLERLRERDLETRVVMVTAIDPGLDIVDMPFDDYLSKPVERDDLRAAIDQQCQVLAYELLGEYFRLESTRAVIDAELPADEIERDDRLADLEARRAAIEERVLGLLPDAEELLTEFSGIDRGRY
ncbi:response regulator [Natrinema pellirubrum DSM 15624]|uniref:Response regulator n=1 Tax=Natrinema pellirubrum (strain DSM 15624 / CIP 106293 / JCM 10476 / NCIMB 786 / 157) TaxID=797303 RepID=L0JMQ5_NATP1|nr:response regulator [Natrinema pellirubrum]AGB31661.1 response regulator with CheY-like receiver, AAA-type ATPase, and DNA-binding domains [Natrinema pellirubrum DSM 15624]ELY73030.1 response regulator [Natrinema pellirubrum DSM 15624]